MRVRECHTRNVPVEEDRTESADVEVFAGRGVEVKNMASSTGPPPREKHGFVWVCRSVCLSAARRTI
jgi:hypothetical protein